jgi:hypothetical protein
LECGTISGGGHIRTLPVAIRDPWETEVRRARRAVATLPVMFIFRWYTNHAARLMNVLPAVRP